MNYLYGPMSGFSLSCIPHSFQIFNNIWKHFNAHIYQKLMHDILVFQFFCLKIYTNFPIKTTTIMKIFFIQKTCLSKDVYQNIVIMKILVKLYFASKQVEFPFSELIIDTQEKIRNMFKLTIRKPKQRQWTSFMIINFDTDFIHCSGVAKLLKMQTGVIHRNIPASNIYWLFQKKIFIKVYWPSKTNKCLYLSKRVALECQGWI